MKKLVLETTAPFQGLPELVAYDEGLFASEGLAIEWADREKDVEKKIDINVISPKGVDPFSSHGKLFEQAGADMYNACEWGNCCRVQDTRIGSSSPAAPSACRSISALLTSPCRCSKAYCRASTSRSAARPTARAIASRP